MIKNNRATIEFDYCSSEDGDPISVKYHTKNEIPCITIDNIEFTYDLIKESIKHIDEELGLNKKSSVVKAKHKTLSIEDVEEETGFNIPDFPQFEIGGEEEIDDSDEIDAFKESEEMPRLISLSDIPENMYDNDGSNEDIDKDLEKNIFDEDIDDGIDLKEIERAVVEGQGISESDYNDLNKISENFPDINKELDNIVEEME